MADDELRPSPGATVWIGPADVDRAEDRAGVGVVHGRGGARPDVVGAHQVLGRVDLHRRVDGQRGAHRVGADRRPRTSAMPGDEPDRVGRAQQAGGPLAPEDRAVGVGDQHDVHGLVGDAHQRAAQQRHHLAERVRGAHAGHVVVAVDDGRGVPVGVDVRGEAALPRLGDERAGDRAGRRPRSRRRRPRAAHGPAPQDRSGDRDRRPAAGFSTATPARVRRGGSSRCTAPAFVISTPGTVAAPPTPPSSPPSSRAATAPSRVQRRGNVTAAYRPASTHRAMPGGRQ